MDGTHNHWMLHKHGSTEPRHMSSDTHLYIFKLLTVKHDVITGSHVNGLKYVYYTSSNDAICSYN